MFSSVDIANTMIEYVTCFFFFAFFHFVLFGCASTFFLKQFVVTSTTQISITHLYIDIAYSLFDGIFRYFLFLGKKSQSGFEHMRLPMYRINHVSLVWKIAYRIPREKVRKTTDLSMLFIVSSNSNFHLNLSRRCCAIHIYRCTRNSNFGSLRRLVRFYLIRKNISKLFDRCCYFKLSLTSTRMLIEQTNCSNCSKLSE